MSAHCTYQHCIGRCTPGPRQRTPSNSSRQMTRAFRTPQSISMSSAQDYNIIYTKYQCHLHNISMPSSHDIKVIHTRHQCHPHTALMLSWDDINFILQTNSKRKSVTNELHEKPTPGKILPDSILPPGRNLSVKYLPPPPLLL
mgnify:CR=1 FL=1